MFKHKRANLEFVENEGNNDHNLNSYQHSNVIHTLIIFFSGIALYIGGLLVTAIVAATRKLGECALQVVLGVCLLSGFFYALAFVGSILSIFFAFFSVISVVTGFIALILTVQEVKELAGPYSSHI